MNPKASATSDAFECPEEFGYYPHPTDCSQYYVCVFGGALLESCTGGLMYSHELQTCDWPRNVGCDVVEETVSPANNGRDLNGHQPQHEAYHAGKRKNIYYHYILFFACFRLNISILLMWKMQKKK